MTVGKLVQFPIDFINKQSSPNYKKGLKKNSKKKKILFTIINLYQVMPTLIDSII